MEILEILELFIIDPKTPKILTKKPCLQLEAFSLPTIRLLFFDASIIDSHRDGRFVLWGFGGRPSKDDPVSHCFALNFNEGNPEVRSVEEMMEVYKNAFRRVVLSGPTHFHELIEMTCALAGDKLDQEHQHYHILLIITDGVINDPEETINA